VNADHGRVTKRVTGYGRLRLPRLAVKVRGKHVPFTTLLAVAFATVLVLSAIFANWVAPYPPNSQALDQILLPPAWLPGGLPAHLLGTDLLGRDILSEIIFGARISLIVGLGAVVLGLLIGVPLGLFAGYFGGRLDKVISRLIDVQLSIPLILLALLFIAIVGPGTGNVIVIQGLASWLIYARLTRAQVLSLKEQPFIEAAHALGAKWSRILALGMLPGLIPPLTVIATLEIGRNIITETSLSFLGVGVMPPDPSWGRMIANGRDVIFVAWWVPTWPGLAITLTVLSFALIGDWLRDLLDPK
jgi:peptide/nickel transport system permease protein